MTHQATLLIVDDERFNINILIDLLAQDYNLLVAKNGQQALIRANGQMKPDLILLDIMMPDMDGYEVCQQLKNNADTQHIPVIFITALTAEEDESQGFSVGAVDYINKPISPLLLKARIKTQLSVQSLITEQKLVNHELDKVNQIKNQFVGMAAHDLKTPLTSIIGMADLLQRVSLDEKTRLDFLQRIHKSSERMLYLINDLLDITTIEDGAFSINPSLQNFSDLIVERTIIFQHQAKQKNIHLECEPSTLPDSYFDPIRITQVIDNLISNAIKFCQADDKITIQINHDELNLHCCVQDQGPGIPNNELGKLFNTFEKLSNQPTAGESSTGLGLSIVKKIIDSHQGHISVESKVGEGSQFCFRLPKQSKI